jgi:putative transposase
VRTVREECLDEVIILNERHLRQTLNEYVTHYNARHTHQSPEQDSPLGMVPVSRQGPIRYRKVLGGIIRDYYREAEQYPSSPRIGFWIVRGEVPFI